MSYPSNEKIVQLRCAILDELAEVLTKGWAGRRREKRVDDDGVRFGEDGSFMGYFDDNKSFSSHLTEK